MHTLQDKGMRIWFCLLPRSSEGHSRGLTKFKYPRTESQYLFFYFCSLQTSFSFFYSDILPEKDSQPTFPTSPHFVGWGFPHLSIINWLCKGVTDLWHDPSPLLFSLLLPYFQLLCKNAIDISFTQCSIIIRGIWNTEWTVSFNFISTGILHVTIHGESDSLVCLQIVPSWKMCSSFQVTQ